MSLWVCRNGHPEISYDGGDHHLQDGPVDCPICAVLATQENHIEQLLDANERREEIINARNKKVEQLEKIVVAKNDEISELESELEAHKKVLCEYQQDVIRQHEKTRGR